MQVYDLVCERRVHAQLRERRVHVLVRERRVHVLEYVVHVLEYVVHVLEYVVHVLEYVVHVQLRECRVHVQKSVHVQANVSHAMDACGFHSFLLHIIRPMPDKLLL